MYTSTHLHLFCEFQKPSLHGVVVVGKLEQVVVRPPPSAEGGGKEGQGSQPSGTGSNPSQPEPSKGHTGPASGGIGGSAGSGQGGTTGNAPGNQNGQAPPPPVSYTPVQDMWEKGFRDLGDENPEHTVTGMLLFYPFYVTAYLEVDTLIRIVQ